MTTPPQKTSKRLIMLNSASSVAAMVVNMSVIVWVTQHLVRGVGSDEYQLWPIMKALMLFMPLLTTILTAGLGRYIVEAYARGDNRRVTQICSTMFLPLLGVCLLVLGGGAIAVWKIDHVLRIPPDQVPSARIMFGLLLFVATIRLPLAPFGVGLYVRQKFILQNAILVGCEFLRAGLLVALVLGLSTRIIWPTVAMASADLAYLGIRLVISCRLVPALRFRRDHIDWSTCRHVTTFGFWTTIANVAHVIRMSLDPLLLNRFSSLDVTVFDIGSLADRNISRAAYVACEPLQPALTAAHATDDHERLNWAFIRGGRYALWCALSLAVPLAVFGRPLVSLYAGNEFVTAATVMTLLLIPYPLVYGSIMVDQLAWAKAAMRAWAPRMLAIQLSNLALTFYLVVGRGMGAVGSALATCLAMGIGVPVLMWPLGMRLAGVRWREWLGKTMLPGVLPGLVGAAVGLLLRIEVDLTTWTSLIACVGVVLMASGCTIVLFGLEEDEKRAIGELAKRLGPVRWLAARRSA